MIRTKTAFVTVSGCDSSDKFAAWKDCDPIYNEVDHRNREHRSAEFLGRQRIPQVLLRQL